MHPKRPIQGFACPRSEVSGRRLWGLFRKRFGTARAFLAGHFVANYVPLVFMEEGGRNLTPEKLPAAERESLYQAADRHLRAVVAALGTEILVGVGAFAAKQAAAALKEQAVRIVTIAHPSPANPAANRDWEGFVTRQLGEAGVWQT
jgi:single-strand selective monofunctional uracil DNA glycosylase